MYEFEGEQSLALSASDESRRERVFAKGADKWRSTRAL